MKKALIARFLLIAMFVAGALLGRFTGNIGEHSQETLDVASSDNFTESWQTAFDAGDYDALRDMYEPDAWLMAQGQPARKGVDDIITYLKTLRNNGMAADVQTASEDITIDGNYMFSTTQWWFEYEPETDSIIRDAGRSFVVFKRGDDGQWRLWRAVKNQSPDVEFKDSDI